VNCDPPIALDRNSQIEISHPEHGLSWRTITDIAKRQPLALRLADRLGRGKGRLRFLDHLNPPPRSAKTPDLSQWESHQLAAAWIGHATILLRIGGKTILTDPVMSNRIGIGMGLFTGGPRRHIAAALNISQLPPLDLILISHAHFDHLDRPTLQRLPKHVPIVTAHNTTDLIRDLGFTNVSELRWGEQIEIGELQLTAQEVRHWGARTFYDRHRGFNGYVIQSANRRILYAGDTAFCDHFKNVKKVDLAIFGIGAYDPFIAAHANPEQVWQMADHVRADFLLPMHHSTFKLSHEPMNEPIERLLDAAGSDVRRVITREVGDAWFVN
jgi:L-ascorbate metabolism protein UlaG (beta-lactamase superfamily)